MRRVVVTGLGVVSPIGNTVAEYWESLIEGRSGIGQITYFDTAEYKVKIAAQVKDFDILKYMDKMQARKCDLFTQYAVAAAADAMEDSQIEGKVTPERLGVYFGSGIGGLITQVSETEKLLAGGPKKVSPMAIPMMISNIAAGTIAIRHNAQGPCIPVVTACATSTHAIGEAFRAIKYAYADAIIAGGSEACITPIAIAGFTNCMALTTEEDPSKACCPFDQNRSGFVMGEGAGAIVLEEYEHAVARGAKIYAELVGYGNTCDAHHITAPHPEAQGASRAIIQAKEEAQIVGDEGVYINAHGTSTPLNDKSETIAIKKAFGDAAYQLSISSTKSMTGHMLGAAGAVEAIAAILALKEGIVPPTIGYTTADPDCDLAITPNKAVAKPLAFSLSTSLGFGGHNGCVAFKKV